MKTLRSWLLLLACSWLAGVALLSSMGSSTPIYGDRSYQNVTASTVTATSASIGTVTATTTHSTVVEKRWFPVGVSNNGTVRGLLSSTAALTAAGTNDVSHAPRASVSFGDTDALVSAAFVITQLPSDWASSSSTDIVLYWHTTATSSSAAWTVATFCAGNDETFDGTFNTADTGGTLTDAALATTTNENTLTKTGVAMVGCAAGDTLFIRVQRNTADGSDALGAAALFDGMELTIRRAT